MRGSAGCALTGAALIAILYGLFFIMMMIEPGVPIIIMILGMAVFVGTVVAFLAWIFKSLSSKGKNE